MNLNINFKQIYFPLILVSTLLLSSASFAQSKLRTDAYVSLNLKVLYDGNPLDSNGLVIKHQTSLIHIFRTNIAVSIGTILLLPGGGFTSLSVKNEGEFTAQFLTNEGYDVALLEYTVTAESSSRKSALADALKTFRLLKNKRKMLGLGTKRLDILGISSGGFLAAQTVQKLTEKEQPDNLILISPSNLNETIAGTVFPVVMPPLQPTARLFASFSGKDNKVWIKSCQEYTKTWEGYDGDATFKLLNDSSFLADKNINPLANNPQLSEVLKAFLNSNPEPKITGANPAAVAVEGKNKKRFAEKCELLRKEKFDLLMIGNSITHNFEKAEYQPIWNQYFAPRNAVNLGISGYRTENVIWNIQNGFLEGQSPKVVVLEIGTNNIDEKNYPTRHTAAQLAGGITEIVRILREKLPHAKIIVMRCFLGCYGGPNPTSHRFILERASDIVSKLADGKHVFICDVNCVFLNKDASINHDMMGDWLHPTPAGAKAWGETMEPLLVKLFGDNMHITK
jgi:acetyl esterase/lipase/lysophospholipase L1-like esterase